MTYRWLIACGVAALALAAGSARADTLTVCTEGSPDFLNSVLSESNTAFDVTEQIGDRLVELEPGTSNLVPALAESWTISDEGLRYTFKLRHGVKFQGNDKWQPTREMNADDVVFSFTRQFDKSNPYYSVNGSDYQSFGDILESSLKSVTRVSDDTVQFDLKQPSASLLNGLTEESFSVWPKEYADAMLKAGTPAQFDLAPLGTGPFQLIQYQKDSLVRFRKFADFWGAKGAQTFREAKVDQLVFSITLDPAVRFARLKTNECQVVRYPAPTDLDAMRATPGIQVVGAPVPAQSFLAFRVDKKPLDDRRVREALAISIDLNSLVKAVFLGNGEPTASLVGKALWGHNDQLKPRPYDPERAKKLLAEAGYPNGFTTDLWAIPVARAYMPNGRRAAEMIQADWAKIGVKVNIVTYEWGEFLRRRRAGESTISEMGGTWDYPDPSELMAWQTCDGVKTGSNVEHWCNKQMDDLIAKADHVTNQDERAKLYQQAQQVFFDDIAGVSLADVTAYGALRSNVHGFKLHFLGGQPFGGVSLSQ
jgi:dipeptide transport system substrate-binding protein